MPANPSGVMGRFVPSGSTLYVLIQVDAPLVLSCGAIEDSMPFRPRCSEAELAQAACIVLCVYMAGLGPLSSR